MNHDKPDMNTSLANFTYSRENAPGELVSEDLRLAGADFVSRGKVTTQAVITPGIDQYQLSGTVHCGFGIVHRPSLTLSRLDGEIQVHRHQCGCRAGSKQQFCAHCAAILLEHYGHADARILPMSTDTLPEEQESTGVRIRLGTREKAGTPVYWTPEDARQLATPNIAVVGGEDTGNSQMLQSIALQLLRQKSQAGETIDLLLFDGLDDYNDSRTTFVDAIGGQVLRLHKLPLNPFNLRGLVRKPQLHTHSAMVFADSLARAYHLSSLQKSTLVQSVVAAYATKGITADPLTWDMPAPTFEDVYAEYSARPQSQRGEDLDHIMENLMLLDLFDPEAPEDTTVYDLIQGPVVMDMSGYPETVKHFTLSLLLELLLAQMQSQDRSLGRDLQKMVLIDNADSLLRAGCPGLEGLLTQGREFGLGLLLSVHSLEAFQDAEFDYLKWIRAWMLHNLEDLRKTDLEFLLQMDIYDSALERLYQESRRLRKLHSLIRLSSEEPVLAEDLPFYQIVGDASQSYLTRPTAVQEAEPLAGMPLLDSIDLDPLVTLDLEEDIPGLKNIFDGL